ncbi:MAG TPA: ABC-type transport auxiliary lipoprotein family protein [Vitreimonas sp.]|uniref:ABC-type transport auxiliary lipoprotein family protein n=1 Tax=Vitreimonas sp. TaxID=3069702 RepID=UPI002D5EA8B3|nr:ABC-type transport auxiliary lipoprotein family protein [Vitreimonas sp.]HYD88729.1 ABC-type transport auxiliary lipoprotein family protein [Vitreimonas sp.]
MMRAVLLASLTLLGGCISLLPKPPPPPRTFVLEAQNVAPLQGAPIDAVISVAEPTGERAILGGDLIWRTGDSIAYVDQTQWSSRAADALQQTLVETLVRQGRFRAAVRAGEAQADYQIRWEVLDFEVQEESMTARFVADVRLVQRGRQIVASRIISTEAPVSSRSSQMAADALARAAREGSARIGEFAAEAAAEAMASAER